MSPVHEKSLSNLKPSLSALCRRMAANPNGIGAGEVTGWATSQVRNCLSKLSCDGELHAARLKGIASRYFATPEAAADYLRAQRAVAGHCITQSGRVMQHHNSRHSRAWWPADAPAVITEHTRITIAPPPARGLRTNTHSEWGG
jgi:hypothetical protein